MDSEYQKFIDEAKEYAQVKYNLLKLELLEKSSKILTIIFIVIIVAILMLVALTYFSLSIIFAIKDCVGGVEAAFCIFGGIFVLLAAIATIFRKQLFLNPIIKALSGVLFEENEDKCDNDN